MLEVVVEVALGIAIVFAGGLLFTNAIEYLGYRMRWTGSFTGSVIAPLFTSTPELIILVVALWVYGGESGEDIGIGTVLGQPFMAATIIFPVIIGVALLGHALGRRNRVSLGVERSMVIPYIFFTVLYPLVLVPALLGSWVKLPSVMVFALAYVLYSYSMYRAKASLIEEAETPYIAVAMRLKGQTVTMVSSVLQLALSIALIFLGARLMVEGIDSLSGVIRVSAMAMAILIAPLATVLPESISAIIWTFKGRDTLAVGAIIGEKVLYSTLYPAIGIALTDWALDIYGLASVLIVEVVSLIILYYIWKGVINATVGLLGLAGYLTFLAIILL